MKSVRSIFIGLTCLGMATASFAQEKETTPEATTYKAEIFGSVEVAGVWIMQEMVVILMLL